MTVTFIIKRVNVDVGLTITSIGADMTDYLDKLAEW